MRVVGPFRAVWRLCLTFLFGVIGSADVMLVSGAERGAPPTPVTGSDSGMFINWSERWLDDVDTNQRNYGMAVTDVDHDGRFDIVVAGFSGPNLVLKYNKDTQNFINIATVDSPYEALRDVQGQAIGVGACDIDGDGFEEIYFLNTNDAYAGISSYDDKLFKWRDGKYVDLYADLVNTNLSAKSYAGRSVACLDRYGTGKYGFVIATYSRSGSGSFSLIEMNEYHRENDIESGMIVLTDSAEEAGITRSCGGRGLVIGPILNLDGRSDIMFVNEGSTFLENRGDNFLFKNLGNGTFVEVAKQMGVADADEAGRGVALADFNDDGRLDIVCGNYDGPNRIFIQHSDKDGSTSFIDKAIPSFQQKRPVRNVIVADFDNDGNLEIFLNSIKDHPNPQPNVLFTATSYGPNHDPGFSQVDIGDAEESDGYGTGAVYLDADDDGVLDLVLSHGEDLAQPIEVYRTLQGEANNYLRVYVLTKYGAPARGATVQVNTNRGRQLTQVVDGGSGYLSQMEPVVHFGLGKDRVKEIMIVWPGGKTFLWLAKDTDINKTLLFYHPDYLTFQAALRASNLTAGTRVNNITEKHSHIEL